MCACVCVCVFMLASAGKRRGGRLEGEAGKEFMEIFLRSKRLRETEVRAGRKVRRERRNNKGQKVNRVEGWWGRSYRRQTSHSAELSC